LAVQGHPHDDYGEELASSRDRSMSPCELRKINREKDEDEIMSDGAGGDEEAEEGAVHGSLSALRLKLMLTNY